MQQRYAQLICFRHSETDLGWVFMAARYIIHTVTDSVIFSNCFILVRVEADHRPILGTLGTRQECALNGTPDHLMSPCTPRVNIVQGIHLPVCFQKVGGNGEPEGNPDNHGDNVQNCMDRNLVSGLNWGPWRCEVITILIEIIPPIWRQKYMFQCMPVFLY